MLLTQLTKEVDIVLEERWTSIGLILVYGRGPRVVVRTAAFHARARGSFFR